MSKITTCIKASIILFTASSVFSTAYAATASGTVTVGIAKPVSISKVRDMNLGIVTKPDQSGDKCVYTYVPTIDGGVDEFITGDSPVRSDCQWVDTGDRSLAVFDVSCESWSEITHTVDFVPGNSANIFVTDIVARVSNDNYWDGKEFDYNTSDTSVHDNLEIHD